jgi:lipopolysaccharide transport system permease protein
MKWQRRNFKHFKELLIELVKREIKARYKQSILGYAWVVLVPLINLAVLTVVFSYFVRVPTGGIPYPLYLFTALIPWTFTSNAIAAATGSLSANSSLITKIYLPREVFPTAAVLAKLIDLLLSFIILLIFIPLFGQSYHLSMLLIPIIFLFHLMLVLGISFILSAVNVFFRDVENILSVLLMVWLYLTPIIYPPEMIPANIRPFFSLNPLMPIINSYRNIILYGVNPPTDSFIYAAVSSTAVFVIGYLFFRNRSKFFADVI